MATVETKQVTFKSLEAEYQEQDDVSFFEYERKTLADIGDGEFYEGKPHLLNISDYTFDEDGQEVTKYRTQLCLVDEDEEEFLQININLKSNEDVQRGVHFKSSLYKLVGGIMEQQQPGWTQKHNIITSVSVKEFKEFIDGLESMTVEIKEVTGSFNYFTFIIRGYN